MRIFVMLVIVILCFGQASAQEYDPAVAGWIDRVDIDSLTSFVRILSGEDSVRVGDTTVLIRRRVGVPGNDLAADYVKQTFEGYGLDAYDHVYRAGGRNVYAVQAGSKYPDQQFIVCAHYDGVTDYCADDNASGVAAVLEAARILSSETLDFTVVYAVWDEEELGLIGSNYYAAMAAGRGDDIRGVLNLDMLAWDSNSDGLCDVHASNTGSSPALADLLVGVDSTYGLGLVPVVRNPGTGASDHASFWGRGYGAILLIEAYYGGDFIPYYHTALDRLDKFNLTYFLNMAKVSVGTISTLATGGLKTTLTVDVGANWNLVSIPVDVANDSVTRLFPNVVAGAYAYSGGPEYQTTGTMAMGKGYWMKFDSAGTVAIAGIAVKAETVAVAEGWNLVGSWSEPVRASMIASDPPGLVTSQFFGYGGGYLPADTIVPGRGYWVKAAIDGKLILSGTIAPPPETRIRIVATAGKPPAPPDVIAGPPPRGTPAEFALGQNYPNPFNPSTRIEYSLPAGSVVRISLCNVLGGEVRRLVDEYQPAGVKSVNLDASDLPSGVYICRMQAGNFSASRKMILMR